MALDLTGALLKRRRATVLVILLLALVGGICIMRIPVTFYPQMSKPKLQIYISASGYAAEDLFNEYDDDIKSLLNSVEDVESIGASYGSGRMIFTLEFPWKVSSDTAKYRTNDAADSIKALLPSLWGDPAVWSVSGGSSGFMAVALYSGELSTDQLYSEAKALLQNRISKARDIDSFFITPMRELRADVTLRQDRLLSLGITSNDVINAVSLGYQSYSMGAFRDGRATFTLRLVSPITSLFKIGEIPVAKLGKRSVYLKDVADVNVRYDLPGNIFRANGEPAVFIVASPKQDGNVKNMADDVNAIVVAGLSEFSRPVSYQSFVDPAQFIDDSIKNVLVAALSGAILSMLVTLALLGIPKNTLIVIISIPLSVVYAFIFFYLFHVSINLISLSGLALSVGMTVDASIVVMENVHRKRLEALRNGSTLSLADIISGAVLEVRSGVVSGIITSICVFFPLSMTAPLAAAILGDLAMAVVFTLVCSLVVSFTIIPVVAYYLFRNEHRSHYTKPINKRGLGYFLEKTSNKIMHTLRSGYARALKALLLHKSARIIFMVASAVALALALFVVAPLIKTEIIADPESDKIFISASNSNVDNALDYMESFTPIEERIVDLLGTDLKSRFLQTQGASSGYLLVTIKSAKNMRKTIELLQSTFVSDDVWNFGFEPYDPAKMPVPETYSLHLRVNGPDRTKITQYMERAVDVISGMKTDKGEKMYLMAFTDPGTSPTTEIALTPREAVFAELPTYTKTNLVTLARQYLSGTKAISMRQEGDKIDVKFAYPTPQNREQVLNMLLPYNGKAIPLGHFFDVAIKEGIRVILTEDGQEAFNIYARAPASTSLSQLKKYKSAVEKELQTQLKMDAGYAVSFVDAQKVINDAIKSLFVALIAGIALIYVALAIQFNSYKMPVIILVAIPLGAIGAIACLAIFKSSISLNSMLGIILLGGTAVNNSILIVDFYMQEHASVEKMEAITRACLLRFAPILSSVLTTLLGMLPIALALGDGSNVIQPLGIAVSGGLAISTGFTLFMIPSILSFVKRPAAKQEI